MIVPVTPCARVVFPTLNEPDVVFTVPLSVIVGVVPVVVPILIVVVEVVAPLVPILIVLVPEVVAPVNIFNVAAADEELALIAIVPVVIFENNAADVDVADVAFMTLIVGVVKVAFVPKDVSEDVVDAEFKD